MWDGRNKQINEEAQVGVNEATREAHDNYWSVFGSSTHVFQEEGIQIVILDNSDIYKGISNADWAKLEEDLSQGAKLHLVFAHMVPFHPQSTHIMGSVTPAVAQQAKDLVKLLEQKKADGYFSGDLHFFANFNSPNGSVKMTTIGAVTSARNFQGPRFGVLTIFDDYSWDVEDVEIQ
ncbi:hypothetical protein HY024_03340 [Candidatus Curtissbacteria bacterium]|nr:hypothetical protein [Candidatus Curtissbacteria bacterium]